MAILGSGLLAVGLVLTVIQLVAFAAITTPVIALDGIGGWLMLSGLLTVVLTGGAEPPPVFVPIAWSHADLFDDDDASFVDWDRFELDFASYARSDR